MASEMTTSHVRAALVILTCHAHFEYLFGETITGLMGEQKEIRIQSEERFPSGFLFSVVYTFRNGSSIDYFGKGSVSQICDNEGFVSLVDGQIDFGTVCQTSPRIGSFPELEQQLPLGNDASFSEAWRGTLPKEFYPRGKRHNYGDIRFGNFEAYPLWQDVKIPYTE